MPYFEGSPNSKIAFIGESPGKIELARNRPFVGDAGELLDKLSHSAGILRSDCYLDNCMQMRPSPTSNDISQHIRFDKKGNCVFKSEDFRREETALLARLKACTANVLVPLGNVPMFVLTGLYHISKRRGSILRSTAQGLEDRKVIPTFHPASVLHSGSGKQGSRFVDEEGKKVPSQYLNKWYISFDLKRVKEESEFPNIILPIRMIRTKPSFEEALDYINSCNKLDRVGYDIETSRITYEMVCFSLAKSEEDGMSIPLFYSKGDYFDPWQESQIMLALGRLLENRNVCKWNQNILFDASHGMRKYGFRMRNVEDTMLAMATLFPDFAKDLATIVSLYTKEPYYKEDSKYAGTAEISNDERFWRYSALDSLVVVEAFPKLREDLVRSGNIEAYERQRNLIEPLIYLGEKGFPIDVEGMRKAAEKAGSDLEEKYQYLYTLCGFPININSSKQLQKYFYIDRGFSPYYKDGALTVDAKALKRLSVKGAQEASLIIEMRHLGKLKSTYYEMKIDPDNRIRCGWHPVGTKWSRMSSSQTIFLTGGNMQNLTPEMKALMHPDPGYILFHYDLSQAENRVVAYVANETRMMKAFEDGVDIHSLTYALIAGKDVKDVSREKGSCELGNGQWSERDWGKRANHALNYNVGAGTFALNYELTTREASDIINRIYLSYPGIKQWHASIRDQLNKDRSLTNLFGRRCQFRDRWDDNLFRSAYSFIPQSSVGDLLNEWGFEYIYYNQDMFGQIELMNQVHDAVVFQVPLDLGPLKAAEMCMHIKKSLEQSLTWSGRVFRIPADLSVGYNMKQMEDIKSNAYETAGRLAELLSPIYRQG
jgi:uracil-DNA glycosylase family 4